MTILPSLVHLGRGGQKFALDGQTSIFAAYSLRRLLSSYTGALVRIRENGGNTEQDFSGTLASGWIDWSAVTTFLNGASGFVTKLYDQSGNGRDAVQATAGAQPGIANSQFGSRPGMSFEGTDDFLATASNVTLSSGSITMLAALKITTWNTWNTVFAVGVSGGGAGIGLLIPGSSFAGRYTANDWDLFGKGYAASINGVTYFQGPSGSPTTTQIVDGTLSSALSEFHANGSAISARGSAVGAVPSVTDVLKIGADSVGDFFNGKFGELILFNADKSAGIGSLSSNMIAAWQ